MRGAVWSGLAAAGRRDGVRPAAVAGGAFVSGAGRCVCSGEDGGECGRFQPEPDSAGDCEPDGDDDSGRGGGGACLRTVRPGGSRGDLDAIAGGHGVQRAAGDDACRGSAGVDCDAAAGRRYSSGSAGGGGFASGDSAAGAGAWCCSIEADAGDGSVWGWRWIEECFGDAGRERGGWGRGAGGGWSSPVAEWGEDAAADSGGVAGAVTAREQSLIACYHRNLKAEKAFTFLYRADGL